MADVMWCENCRMRLGIDVDCDIAGHVHRPMRAVETGTDGRSKDGDDIVTRLRHRIERGFVACNCDRCRAADEIERLRAAGETLAKAVTTYCGDEAWADRALTAYKEARHG